MTTSRIILVSFMVDTVKNVTRNNQLPVRVTMLSTSWVENECKPHPYRAISCT